MNFSGKEGHPNIQPSTRPGIEPGTSGLGGRDLNHCANPSAKFSELYQAQKIFYLLLLHHHLAVVLFATAEEALPLERKFLDCVKGSHSILNCCSGTGCG